MTLADRRKIRKLLEIVRRRLGRPGERSRASRRRYALDLHESLRRTAEVYAILAARPFRNAGPGGYWLEVPSGSFVPTSEALGG